MAGKRNAVAKWTPEDAWMAFPSTLAQSLSVQDCPECVRLKKLTKTPADPDDALVHTCWRNCAHLHYIAEAIAEAVDGIGCRNIIVEAPVRHGKSVEISKWTPTWFLERHPEQRVMLFAYGDDFAATWGGEVRDTLERYQDYLSVRVCPDNAARDLWKTTEGGGMMTAGVGGRGTGSGANLLIIDDPIKNAQEAHSQAYRDHCWDWFQSVPWLRREPRATTIVTMARWDEDDLVGRLKKQNERGESKWRVISLPALAEANDQLGRKPGEALWPTRYTADDLAITKRGLGSWVWNALYQQHPTIPEGNYFKRQWFRTVPREQVPELTNVVRYWDLAGTAEGEGTNPDPDYTAGLKMGRSRTGVFYILDVRHFRKRPLDVEEEVRRAAQQDGRNVSVWIEREPGQSGESQIGHYRRDVLPGYDVRGEKPWQDKFVRSQAFNAVCEAGEVVLIDGPWTTEFIEELCRFDGTKAGGHDDQVDTAVGAHDKLTRRGAGWSESTIRQIFNPADSYHEPSYIERLKAACNSGQGDN